ncbi:MAG: Spy/CpxP family protein refolding chaperone [Gemmatimonadota bacterium]
MKRKIVLGVALAMTLAAASASQAQEAQPEKKDHKAHAEHMQRASGGGPLGMLLEGIELTAEQRQQIQAAREKLGEGRARGEHRGQTDGPVSREDREKARAEMKQHHERMLTEIRALLTPEQREVFDKNVEQARELMKQREQRMQKRRNQEKN